jgi:hypothetical protein
MLDLSYGRRRGPAMLSSSGLHSLPFWDFPRSNSPRLSSTACFSGEGTQDTDPSRLGLDPGLVLLRPSALAAGVFVSAAFFWLDG